MRVFLGMPDQPGEMSPGLDTKKDFFGGAAEYVGSCCHVMSLTTRRGAMPGQVAMRDSDRSIQASSTARSIYLFFVFISV